MDNYEDFISTVSHELRTPLTSIRGFSQTMLASWDKLDDESKKKFLNIIVEQSNRLINLVENMLSVTKLHNAKENLILKEFSIKQPIETVASIVKNQYKDKNFEIIIDKSTPAILADTDKFQQVMTNLIENAAKYGLENSTITIKAGLLGSGTTGVESQNSTPGNENAASVGRNYYSDNENVSIKVINFGSEIPSEDYEKIFTKFARIDNPLTRKVQGSGLGLYITKNLVEKMGGKISVNSTLKSGSKDVYVNTFEVILPAENIEQQAREKCSQ